MAKIANREPQVLKVIQRTSKENPNASISVESREVFRFGEFCFSLCERRLARGTEEIALAPKAQDMLYLFLEHPGQLLSKEFLLHKLWPDSFVEEAALSVYVSILRKALGDTTAACRYIETVPKSGYRFIVQVSRETLAPPASALPPPSAVGVKRLVTVASIVLAVFSGAFFLSHVRRQPQVFTYYALERSHPLTSSPGVVYQPALSPDGESLAYAWAPFDNGPINIYVQNGASAERFPLTEGPSISFAPAWSPDGRRIAYLHADRDGAVVEVLVKDPNPRSTPRKVAELGRFVSTLSPIPSLDWSPDGALLLSSATADDVRFASLVLISATTGEKTLLTHPAPDGADADGRFSWDGETIVFRRHLGSSMDDLYSMPARGGAARRLTSGMRLIRGLAWSSEGHSLIVASDRATGFTTLWRVFLDGDGQPPVQLTIPVGYASAPVVARQSQRLAFVSEVNNVNIWKASLTSPGKPSPVIASIFLNTSPDISPDGASIAFRSNRTGSDEIWIADNQGRNPRQLTHFGGPLTGSPRWSPDGRWLAFDSTASGNADIYAVRVDDGALRRITNAPSDEVVPSWSRDGQYLYFTSNRTGRPEIWKTPFNGGEDQSQSQSEAKQITRDGGFDAVESADGRTLYYVHDMATTSVWRMPVAGGAPTAVIDSVGQRLWGYWAVSPHYLMYFHRRSPTDGSTEILGMNPATGEIRHLGAVERALEAGGGGLSISPDERWIVYAQRDTYQTSIMLAEGH
jgi:Tol biopolymer transport system component/DNA-binding winged helix-turn-helix (wHTH) protein